ncbi:MAG: peptidylprolyl isomerase, partial [Terriglobia bacterium]
PQARQQIESQGRRSIADQYATLLVLSQAAEINHLDSSSTFQKAMKQRREQLLASLEYQKLASRAMVTSGEVNQYYSAHSSEFQQAQIREVAIRKAQAGQSGGSGLSPQAAQARAESIRKALASGEAVEKVAQQYAVPQEVVVDTQVRTIHNDPGLPEFVKSAFQLKKGELSPIQDTPNAIVFFQVVDHPQMTVQEAAPQIENALRQQKVDAAVAILKKQTPIWMDPSYFSSKASSPPAKP